MFPRPIAQHCRQALVYGYHVNTANHCVGHIPPDQRALRAITGTDLASSHEDLDRIAGAKESTETICALHVASDMQPAHLQQYHVAACTEQTSSWQLCASSATTQSDMAQKW